MSSQQSGQGIEELYRSVMNDVISQVKEAFLDENIDVDVLYQLKKMWEDKVNQSGAVDLTPKPLQVPNIRQSNRPPATTARPMVLSQPGPSTAQVLIQRPTATHQAVYQQQVSQVIPSQGGIQFVQGTAISQPGQVATAVQIPSNYRVIQGIPGQPNFIQGTSNSIPSNIMILPGGQQVFRVQQLFQVSTGSNNSNVIQAPIRPQMPAPTKSEPTMHFSQLDGASYIPVFDTNNSNTKKSNEIKKKAKKIPQLDGGPGMTDSSSEDDLEDEEDDPLRRMANRIGDEDHQDTDENVVEEEPLNSNDDQSDDEALETLFDSSNVVVCQFEKVHRARNKWKFALKDGIMNIRGKDYCFQKCTGEAEW